MLYFTFLCVYETHGREWLISAWFVCLCVCLMPVALGETDPNRRQTFCLLYFQLLLRLLLLLLCICSNTKIFYKRDRYKTISRNKDNFYYYWLCEAEKYLFWGLFLFLFFWPSNMANALSCLKVIFNHRKILMNLWDRIEWTLILTKVSQYICRL